MTVIDWSDIGTHPAHQILFDLRANYKKDRIVKVRTTSGQEYETKLLNLADNNKMYLMIRCNGYRVHLPYDQVESVAVQNLQPNKASA